VDHDGLSDVGLVSPLKSADKSDGSCGILAACGDEGKWPREQIRRLLIDGESSGHDVEIKHTN
jgi:hypothetical protein